MLRSWLPTLSSCVFLVFVWGFCIPGTHGNTKESTNTTLTFSGPTLLPASGHKADSLVVLFHGGGDTGENFVLLGGLLRNFLPNTVFVAPNGPRRSKDIPSGKLWLSAGKKDPTRLLREMKNLAPSLNLYLDNLLKTYGLPPEKLALVGFSQGMRVALHIGLRRPCAGIVAFSGAFLDDPAALYHYHPPILLVHGLEDAKAPCSLAREAQRRLKALHMPVTLFLLPGLGHDIDPRSLELGGEFLRDCLYLPQNKE